jgi:hypothetical protein
MEHNTFKAVCGLYFENRWPNYGLLMNILLQNMTGKVSIGVKLKYICEIINDMKSYR